MKVSRREGLERLLRLALHLTSVEPKEFDMRVWWCGTKGCSLGHATNIPEFRELGLKLVPLKFGLDSRVILGEKTGIFAAREFFSLSYAEACMLFNATLGDNRAPVDLAKEYRDFVVGELKSLEKEESR